MKEQDFANIFWNAIRKIECSARLSGFNIDKAIAEKQELAGISAMGMDEVLAVMAEANEDEMTKHPIYWLAIARKWESSQKVGSYIEEQSSKWDRIGSTTGVRKVLPIHKQFKFV